MFEKIRKLIERYDTIILHRHLKPDGDALGSQIGLKRLILDNYPGKQVYMVGDEAGRYAFMADCAMDTVTDAQYAGALAILLDTSAPHLVSDTRYTLAEATARIDHHLFLGKMCDVEVIDSSFESCCGLIAAFAQESGYALSPLAARSLFTGMVTDSGRFISIHAPLAGCDFRTGHDVGAEFWENRSAGDWRRRGAEKNRLRVLGVRDDVLQGALLIVLVFLRLVDHKQVKPLTEAALAGTRAEFDLTAGRELDMLLAVCAVR